MEFVKTYLEFLRMGLSRLDADVIAYIGMFDKGCYQTNKVIAENLVSTSNRIRVVINNLVCAGWLLSSINQKAGNTRTLYVSDKAARVMNGAGNPMIENDRTYDRKRSDPMIINDHTSDHSRSDPMIENDHTYDQKRSPYFINRKLIENIKEKGIDMCSAGNENPAGNNTHTASLSQHCKIPDAETIASQFIANNPELIRDVAITEATKFRNYYLSHPNKCPENNFWKGLISNWQINDRDKLFAKNSLNSGEKRQETDYSEQFKNVNHAAIAQWLNLGGVCKN